MSYMNYLIESIFVGIYVCTMYLLFSPFIQNFYFLLLVCGFFKHFLSSHSGIHTLYCNNGEACNKVLNGDKCYETDRTYLIRDSVFESFAFLIVGIVLSNVISNKIYLFFVMGILLHICSEHIGIHKHFCKNACYIKE